MKIMTMTFPEFEQEVADLLECGTPESLQWVLTEAWVTGGMSGGSCWGDSADYPVEGDPEPEHDVLDKILEEFTPDLSFLLYRKLMKADIYLVASNNCHEYYGNYTTGKKRTLDLFVLFTTLRELIGD